MALLAGQGCAGAVLLRSGQQPGAGDLVLALRLAAGRRHHECGAAHRADLHRGLAGGDTGVAVRDAVHGQEGPPLAAVDPQAAGRPDGGVVPAEGQQWRPRVDDLLDLDAGTGQAGDEGLLADLEHVRGVAHQHGRRSTGVGRPTGQHRVPGRGCRRCGREQARRRGAADPGRDQGGHGAEQPTPAQPCIAVGARCARCGRRASCARCARCAGLPCGRGRRAVEPGGQLRESASEVLDLPPQRPHLAVRAPVPLVLLALDACVGLGHGMSLGRGAAHRSAPPAGWHRLSRSGDLFAQSRRTFTYRSDSGSDGAVRRPVWDAGPGSNRLPTMGSGADLPRDLPGPVIRAPTSW